jgi:uncharacterized membrane protein YeaQ/YmgE (transglycosylase-associated protein family)
VAITVCVSLPFGIWLGNYNLPIWASFIVWAEYFAMGANPAVLKTMVPAYILGVIGATILMTVYALLSTALGTAKIYTPNDLALYIACFVGFSVLIYAMKWFPVTQTGTLPFFNGISMLLGIYFTGAFVKPFGPTLDPNLLPTAAGVGAILAGLLGAALGWFNVTILFPRPVAKSPGA